jgi:hypothetical protein
MVLTKPESRDRWSRSRTASTPIERVTPWPQPQSPVLSPTIEPRDRILRRRAQSQPPSRQHDRSQTIGATRQKGNYVAKNAFGDISCHDTIPSATELARPQGHVRRTISTKGDHTKRRRRCRPSQVTLHVCNHRNISQEMEHGQLNHLAFLAKLADFKSPTGGCPKCRVRQAL